MALILDLFSKVGPMELLVIAAAALLLSAKLGLAKPREVAEEITQAIEKFREAFPFLDLQKLADGTLLFVAVYLVLLVLAAILDSATV